MRCLRTIAHVNWKDMIPNETVLQKTNMLKIDEIIRTRRLRWAGHLSRMDTERIPHQIAFSQLREGKRAQQKPKKRWTDLVKNDLKQLEINENNWRLTAADRNLWRSKIHENIARKHERNIQEATQKRQEQHEEQDQWKWQCPLCEFTREGRRGRQYVSSHMSQAHKERIPVRNNSLICEHCGFVSKSKSGLTSHTKHRHPDAQSDSLQPIKISLRENVPTSNTQPSNQSQSTPSNNDPTCLACGRIFKSTAGLKSHMRGAACRGTAQSQTTSSR
ncbi:hypothetical protein M8J77_011688 [Diaphorina citri]|nr:hypothetical protein M8J77_011688 [Diaphorina citri]